MTVFLPLKLKIPSDLKNDFRRDGTKRAHPVPAEWLKPPTLDIRLDRANPWAEGAPSDGAKFRLRAAKDGEGGAAYGGEMCRTAVDADEESSLF